VPGIKLAVVLLCGVLLVAVVTVLFQAIKASQTREDFTRQTAAIETNLTSLVTQLNALRATNRSTSTTTPTEEPRILLTMDTVSAILPEEPSVWNKDLGERKISYINTDRGISLLLPYEPQWGNRKYAVTPYEWAQDAEGIDFGPLHQFCNEDATCEWLHDGTLLFLPQRSAEEAIAAGESAEEAGSIITMKRLRLGSHDVVQGTLRSDSATDTTDVFIWYEVIGKRYNYVFHGRTATMTALLEHVMQTIVFLK